MRFRLPLVLVAAVVAVSACSGDPDPAESSPTVASVPDANATTSDSTSDDAAADDAVEDAESDASADDAAARAAVEEVARYDVAVEYSIADGAAGAELAVSVRSDELGDLDPFGRFASCSGLREVVGAYSLVVSDPGNGAIGLLTDGPVRGPGIYEADVRIEPASGGAVTASGTITLDTALDGGSFLAFTPGGAQVDGTFTCEGGSFTTPLENLDADGAAKIEVFALLGRGDAQRVVGAAALADGEFDAACPAAEGVDGGVLVRLDGDERVGAISTFELTDGAAPTMRLSVGGTRLEVDGVRLSSVDGAAAAAFSGTADDGTQIDGAYRCS